MYVRKNAANLTGEEWRRLMEAIVRLKHMFSAGSNVSVYDQFVAIHPGVVRLAGAQTVNGAHNAAAFLPWHREYLRRYENALQSVDPRVTLPYWNWGLGGLSETTALFQDDRMGPMGSGGAGFDVATGYLALNPNAFNPLGWSIRPELRPFGQALQRNQALDTGAGWPTAISVTNLLIQGAYQLFRPGLEQSPHHNRIHGRIGGDMLRMTSPNDPIFFLHHCQVDRIWAKWQVDHPGSANYNPLGRGGQGHRLNDRMWPWDGGDSQTTAVGIGNLLPTYAATDIVRPVDVLDHHALGYCYDDEPGCPCPEVDQPPSEFRGEARPNLPIPDDSPAGIVSHIDIVGTGSLTDITVAVDITHTWRGDLQVTLIAPNGFPAELHRMTGGSAQNLRRSFSPDDTPDLANLVQGGVEVGGRWTLNVSDNAGQDVGRLNSWSLDLRAA